MILGYHEREFFWLLGLQSYLNFVFGNFEPNFGIFFFLNFECSISKEKSSLPLHRLPKKFLQNIYKIKDIYIYKKKIYIDFSYDIISMV